MADEPVAAWAEPWTRKLLRWLTRHRTGVTGAAAAVMAGVVGLAAVLGVQAQANVNLRRANNNLEKANQQITQANADLKLANDRVTQANTDLKSANERATQRFDLAMEAINLFHGDASEDLLLKEKQFGKLRGKLLTGAANFYGKLEGLLAGQTDPRSRASLGQAYFELAKLTDQIGTEKEAIEVHRKALGVRRELAARPDAFADPTVDVVRSPLRDRRPSSKRRRHGWGARVVPGGDDLGRGAGDVGSRI